MLAIAVVLSGMAAGTVQEVLPLILIIINNLQQSLHLKCSEDVS